MFRGTKKPIKNFPLVVKNIIKEATHPTPLMQGFDFSKISKEWILEDRLLGHRFSKKVVSGLFDVLEDKLRDKEFDQLNLWSTLIDYGINPVDSFLPTISTSSIWWTGREKMVPELHCQTSSNPAMASFDAGSVMTRVISMDAVYERLLELKPIIYEQDESPEFIGPKARLFAVLATTDNALVHAAFSPLIQSCFDAWVDELKGMGDQYKMACSGYILNRFERLTGLFNRQCHIDFFEPCHEFFFHAIGKLAELKIDPNTQNKLGIRGVDHLKYIFDYLGMGLSERSESARIIARCGNPQLTAGLLISLIRHPEEYAKTLRSFDASNDLAQDLLRRNLHDDVYANTSYYLDLSAAEAFVERLREAFKAQGYDDLVGSKGLDGLVVSLEVGEFFEKKGYLRRERMEWTGTFAANVSWVGVPTATDSAERRAFGLSVIHRKVDLAVKLGQQQLLIDNFDKSFKGHHELNPDLAKDEALRYVLESGGLAPSDILTTALRIKKASQAGVSNTTLAQGLKLTKQVKGELLVYALGL